MKVAFIGNMNNNNFSIMRYFRDLGVDAHLLLWSDDGAFSSSHFGPESDTWNFEKWSPFIHRTRISNSVAPALGFSLSLLASLHFAVRRLISSRTVKVMPVSRKYLNALLAGYDCVIGTGNVPAICDKAGRTLDIFAPYSTGIEYVDNLSTRAVLKHKNPLVRLIYREMAQRQVNGLINTRYILNAEVGPSAETLRAYGLNYQALAMPMVYDNEQQPLVAPNEVLRRAEVVMSSSDLVLFSHARLMWNIEKIPENDESGSKNNHWLLIAIANLIKIKPELKVVLFLVEYGPDVEETKELARQLGISEKIHWLPKLQRREIMWLLSKADIGVGEFYNVPNMIWGGTGWETLACGKPLLQGFNFDPGAFERFYGHTPPPMLPVRQQEDIVVHLLEMAENPDRRNKIGCGAREWFRHNNGVGLAGQWLDLLQKPSTGSCGGKPHLDKTSKRIE